MITQEKINQIANDMQASGTKITSREVRRLLGAGSMATILPLLRVWKAGQVRPPDVKDELVAPTIGRAINHFLADELQRAVAEHADRIAEMQLDIDALIVENKSQACELESKIAENLGLLEKVQLSAGKIEQLQKENLSLESKIQEASAARDEMQVLLARCTVRIEQLPDLHAELEKLRASERAACEVAAELRGRLMSGSVTPEVNAITPQ